MLQKWRYTVNRHASKLKALHLEHASINFSGLDDDDEVAQRGKAMADKLTKILVDGEDRLKRSVYQKTVPQLHEKFKKIVQKYNEVEDSKDERDKVKEELRLQLPIYSQ